MKNIKAWSGGKIRQMLKSPQRIQAGWWWNGFLHCGRRAWLVPLYACNPECFGIECVQRQWFGCLLTATHGTHAQRAPPQSVVMSIMVVLHEIWINWEMRVSRWSIQAQQNIKAKLNLDRLTLSMSISWISCTLLMCVGAVWSRIIEDCLTVNIKEITTITSLFSIKWEDICCPQEMKEIMLEGQQNRISKMIPSCTLKKHAWMHQWLTKTCPCESARNDTHIVEW